LNPVAPAVPRDGVVELRDVAGIPAALASYGADGGRIRIKAGTLVLDGGVLVALNTGAAMGRDGVDIAAQTATIQARATELGPTGMVQTLSAGSGQAGPIRVAITNDLSLVNAQIFSTPLQAGAGGSVAIEVGRLQMTGGAIGAPLLRPVTGLSGSTIVTAREAISLEQGAAIVNASLSSNPAGPLVVRSSGPLTLTGGSQISADALASGAGGTVNVTAASLHLDNSTISAATISSGDAGDVMVAADRIALVNQGNISTVTVASGAGGDIAIDTSVLMADSASDLPGLGLSGIVVATGPESTGAAGSITLRADRIDLSNGGQISGVVRGSGEGGQIAIQANDLVISGQVVRDGDVFPSSIQASTEVGSSGRAGSITVDAQRLNVLGGGGISSATRGSGSGGPVELRLGDLMLRGGVADNGTGGASVVSASAEPGSTGDAGSITIAADIVDLQQGGRIVGSTSAAGRGGTVTCPHHARHRTVVRGRANLSQRCFRFGRAGQYRRCWNNQIDR
jgi:large exoprotein involved in heme utilization and adhesion